MGKSIPFGKLACLLTLFLFITSGCAAHKSTNAPPAPATQAASATKEESLSYKGTIGNVSEKAKSFAIQVGPEGKAETMIVKYDGKTRGVEFAKKGDSVTIAYELRDQEPYAISIKPNLAKLPDGVSEIKTAELKSLIDKKADLEIFDSRPESRYAQSHLPGALSVSVEKLAKEQGAALPKNKEKLLIFYCGGPT